MATAQAIAGIGRIPNLLVGLFMVLAAGPAQAQAWMPPPENVVNLSAEASERVPHDRILITLVTQHEGPQAAAVQARLKQDLAAALALARTEAKAVGDPLALDLRTGNFVVSPRHDASQRISRWVGRAELLLQGRDLARISELAGRLESMSVQGVAYGLSEPTRHTAEARVLAAAVERFRAKASDAARLFGFAGYALREVHLGQIETPGPRPMLLARGRTASSMASEAVPTEAGDAEVRVQVQGSVQLTR